MDKENEETNGNNRPKSLTCIRRAYTLCDTPEPESNEIESLIIKTFLNTLAEVAIAIASREVS